MTLPSHGKDPRFKAPFSTDKRREQVRLFPLRQKRAKTRPKKYATASEKSCGAKMEMTLMISRGFRSTAF